MKNKMKAWRKPGAGPLAFAESGRQKKRRGFALRAARVQKALAKLLAVGV
jgi:hypothetical protein